MKRFVFVVALLCVMGCKSNDPSQSRRAGKGAGLQAMVPRIDLAVSNYRPDVSPVINAMAVNLISQPRVIEWTLGEYDRRSHLFAPTARLTMGDLTPASIARFLTVTTPAGSPVPVLLSHDFQPVNERSTGSIPREAGEYFQDLLRAFQEARLNILIIDDPQLHWSFSRSPQ